MNLLTKLVRSIKSWFIGKYLEFLLWLDDFGVGSGSGGGSSDPLGLGFLGGGNAELTKVVVSMQQLAYREGIGNIKRQINSLVKAKTKEEYDAVLKEVGDLVTLAKVPNKQLDILKQSMYSVYVKTGGKDVKNDTDKAKMIEQRIDDFKELQEHKLQRELRRKIRQAKVAGDIELANSLQKEWQEKYGKTRRH